MLIPIHKEIKLNPDELEEGTIVLIIKTPKGNVFSLGVRGKVSINYKTVLEHFDILYETARLTLIRENR